MSNTVSEVCANKEASGRVAVGQTTTLTNHVRTYQASPMSDSDIGQQNSAALGSHGADGDQTRHGAGRLRASARALRAPLALCCLSLLAGSCSEATIDPPNYAFVMTEVSLISTAEPDGSVIGLNLDGRVDDEPSLETCNKIDFTAPDGTPGIDNQVSLFGAVLGLFGGDPEALVQGAINEGSLLVLLEFEGLDSFENDNDVTVRIHFGEGPTDVGNDGRLVPGQSFDIKPGTTSVEVRNVRVVDGHVDVVGFETVLPVSILDQRFDLPIFSGQLSLDFDAENGEVDGLLGGGLPTRTLIDDLIRMIPGGQDVEPIATLALTRLADLNPNELGMCDQVSTALTVHAVTAFLLPPEDAPVE